jgi:hypothetical protein
MRTSHYAALVAAFVLSTAGVSCKGTVVTDPTTDQVQAVRVKAVQAAAATEQGLKIIEEVDDLVNSLPVPTATKDTIGCSVIKVTGTSQAPSETVTKTCQPIVGDLPQGPGPLHKALGELKAVTAEPALRNTARAIMDAVRPLLEKLDQSDNQALKFAAMSIRTSLGYLSTL